MKNVNHWEHPTKFVRLGGYDKHRERIAGLVFSSRVYWNRRVQTEWLRSYQLRVHRHQVRVHNIIVARRARSLYQESEQRDLPW